MSTTIRRVLVALDLGPASGPVLALAAEAARRFDARLTALHVIEGIDELRGLNLPHVSYDEILPDLEGNARRRLGGFLREASAPREAEAAVAVGEPYEEILEAAGALPADLVVLGTHGRRGLERAIFGSTAERVVRAARVPVLTVPVRE